MNNLINYNNNNLKKITNIYQLKYKNGVAQGFGDYLNGCFFLFQLCLKNNISFEMNFKNHPISKYFINESNSIDQNETIDYDNILYYNLDENIRKNKYLLYNTFITNINNINTQTYNLFCNLNPIYPIQEIGREIIKSKIIPNKEIENSVQSLLDNFNLKPYSYEIIHIRSGDKYLLSNQKLDFETFKKYVIFLKNNTNPNSSYILISDNNELKTKIKKSNIFTNIFIDDLMSICHTGENCIKTEESLKNTVVDFFTMSKSKNIISISLQSRGGTGFSRLCATIFNIPYKSLLIDLGHHLQ